MVRGLWYALVACILLGTTMECQAGVSHRELEQLEDRIPNQVTAKILWADCGDWNGYYYPEADTIVLCNENDTLTPGAQRVLALHEMGHAYAFEHHMTFERWEDNYEDEADEFAIAMTLAQGRPEDLVDMARTWEAFDRKTNGPIPGDTHSPSLLRAKRLRDAYWGYNMLFAPPYFYFKELVEFWHEQFLKDDNDGHN